MPEVAQLVEQVRLNGLCVGSSPTFGPNIRFIMKKFFSRIFEMFKHDPYQATEDAMRAERFSEEDIRRVVERMKNLDWEYMQW